MVFWVGEKRELISTPLSASLLPRGLLISEKSHSSSWAV